MAEVFARYRVEYLIIGKSGAILHGFPDTTQAIDVFPKNTPENGRRMVAALRALGFEVDPPLEAAIVQGKDFIQLRGDPVDVDLVFAPDGLASFAVTQQRATTVERLYPVAAIEDIIASKRRAGRQKDRDVLERLEAFATYLRQRR